MRVSLGVGARAAEAGSPVPAATRAVTPGWRDPRLWVGLLIVAVSVVVGARVLAGADDTVAVWAVADDAGPGAELTDADLEVRQVRFADDDALGAYFSADAELPASMRLVRAVGAGELLPRAAIGAAGTADVVELPIAVDPGQVPPSVRAGSVVDVYLAGSDRRRGGDGFEPLLAEVTVVAAPGREGAFGSVSGLQQLVLAVPESDAARYLSAVGDAEQPLLTVVRRS